MDTPQPAAKASTKKKKMKEKGTSHETKEWERRWRRGTLGIYLVPLVHLGAAWICPSHRLPLPSPIGRPGPRKELTWRDVEQILHDSGILHDREARDGRDQDGG